MKLVTCDVVETDNSRKVSMLLLNEYLSSVFVLDDGSLHEFARRVSQHTFIKDIEITTYRVLYFIDKSKTGSAPGPDDIPGQFLKQFKFQLLQPLVVLYRYLMDRGQIPPHWKLANVRPVFQKVSNYRENRFDHDLCQHFVNTKCPSFGKCGLQNLGAVQ